MGKKLKCYGRKKSTVSENSATRAFFDEFKCKASFGSKENSSTTKTMALRTRKKKVLTKHRLSLNKTSKTRKRLSLNKTSKTRKLRTRKKKVLTKLKLPLKTKSKKYKGKRKFKTKVSIKAQHEGEPNWKSILEHSLAIEPCYVRLELLNISDIKEKYGVSKPAPAKETNSNTYSQEFIQLTSTPVKPPKTLAVKCANFLNLSAIRASQRKRKSEISFESSSATEISIPKKDQSRSLKLRKRSLSVLRNSECLQNKLSQKSHSNIGRSFFLKSDSCLKEVPIKNFEDPSILHKLFELCNQNEAVAFVDSYDWKNSAFRKVGEGSYGEVFMCTKNRKSVIIKIIPVSEDFRTTIQSMESVYSEIKVSLCLNELRNNEDFQTNNFNFLKKACVVQGAYPVKLLGAWDAYSNVKTTYNDRPDMFSEEQIYVILESEYGGKDMSSFVFRNAVEAESILKQTAFSLAIAEETHLFEHRDLHLGNILVQRTNRKNISYKFRGESISIPSEGVLVTIIDFTLSRILDDGCVYYNDLAEDESLFTQTGDFQFEVYRATKIELNNMWHECLLYSNILWLKFLCIKFEEHEYSRASTVKHKKGIENIKIFAGKLNTCKRALDCLIECNILPSLPKESHVPDSKKNSEIFFFDRKSVQQRSNLFNKI